MVVKVAFSNVSRTECRDSVDMIFVARRGQGVRFGSRYGRHKQCTGQEYRE